MLTIQCIIIFICPYYLVNQQIIASTLFYSIIFIISFCYKISYEYFLLFPLFCPILHAYRRLFCYIFFLIEQLFSVVNKWSKYGQKTLFLNASYKISLQGNINYCERRSKSIPPGGAKLYHLLIIQPRPFWLREYQTADSAIDADALEDPGTAFL